MAVTTKKSLLFLAGGVAAAAAVAYAAGAFDPLLTRAPETIAALPEADGGDSTSAQPPAAETPAAAPEMPAAAPEDAATEPTTPQPEAPAAPTPPDRAVVPPSFDVVRVEGDGSIVVAGKAFPNAKVDLLVGSNVIGEATAGADGDFAVVLDDPLDPGDYQIVLRATAPDNVVAMSVETAVVSVPETPEGQVLALVEEPGKPSQMITLPKPQPPAADAKPPVAPTAEAPAPESATPGTPPVRLDAAPAGEEQAALPAETAPAPATPPPAGPTVRVEAVEIDGRKIFVAGSADPGRTVRGYANEILLGDAKASPDGRYLIEAERDLPVGDYIIRVDALEQDGVKVAARAAVPFEREPGETIAAVAPPEPEPTVPAAQPPAAEPPAAVAPAVPGTDDDAAPTTTGTPPVAAEVPSASPEQPDQPPVTAEAPDATVPAASGQPEAVAEAPAEQLARGETTTPATEKPTASPSGQASAPRTAEPADQPVAEPPMAEAPAAQPPVMAEAPGGGSQPSAAAPPAQTVMDDPGDIQRGAPPAAEQPARIAPAAPPIVAEAPETEFPSAQAPAAEAPSAGKVETDVASAPAEDDAELPAPPPAEGVQEVLAPKLESVGSAVIIRRGDTLWRISRRVYGRGVRYSTIYLANQDQIEDPDRIWPGQVFKVPEKSNDGKAEADYSTLGNRLTTVPEESPASAEGQ